MSSSSLDAERSHGCLEEPVDLPPSFYNLFNRKDHPTLTTKVFLIKNQGSLWSSAQGDPKSTTTITYIQKDLPKPILICQ
jgi:hypothetical protein